MQSKIKSLRERKREYGLGEESILYIVAVSFFLSASILEKSLAGLEGRVISVIRYAGYGLIIWKVYKDAYDRERIIKYLCALAVFALGLIFNRNKIMLFYAFIIFAAINVESEVIIKTYFCIQAIFITGIVLLSQLGVIFDYVYRLPDRIRHFLGFDFPTFAPFMFLFMILEYLYIKKGKINIVEYAIGMLGSFWLYKLTDTTYTFLISIAVLTFFLIVQFWIDKGYITFTFRKLLVLFPWLGALFSIVAQWAYNGNNETWVKLNTLVHDRLRLGHSAIYDYGFSLFGRSIEWKINTYFTKVADAEYNCVDSSYLRIALQQGTLFLILVLAVCSYIIYKMIKAEKYYCAWIIVFMAAFCITESVLVDVRFNPFVSLALSLIVKDVSEYVICRVKQKAKNAEKTSLPK